MYSLIAESTPMNMLYIQCAEHVASNHCPTQPTGRVGWEGHVQVDKSIRG